jgi:hypothetical protein
MAIVAIEVHILIDFSLTCVPRMPSKPVGYINTGNAYVHKKKDNKKNKL